MSAFLIENRECILVGTIVFAAFCYAIWAILRVGHDCHQELESDFEDVTRRNEK
jgi:hypothetical protein